MEQDFRLELGDCLDVMKSIEQHSVDCIITDLPYGVLNKSSEGGKWDSAIPLEPLWQNLRAAAKLNAAIVFFAQGMFTATLMLSNPKMWKYNLIWDKCRCSGFLNSKRMPLRCHEDICVFYDRLPTYNPQMEKAEPGHKTHSRGKVNSNKLTNTNRCYGDYVKIEDGDLSMKYPRSILSFPRPHCTGNHPTEKSVDLCRWLIRTYTNPGETVLDATMGSGTTGVAAMLEGRKFIGIEKEQKYFDIAKRRIEEAYNEKHPVV